MSNRPGTIAELGDWAHRHEEDDATRHKQTQEKFSELPQLVQAMVQRQGTRILAWTGVGGIALVVGVGIAWGSLTTQVAHHEQKLSQVLDQKDLANIQRQLDSQTASVNEIKGDVKAIIRTWNIKTDSPAP